MRWYPALKILREYTLKRTCWLQYNRPQKILFRLHSMHWVFSKCRDSDLRTDSSTSKLLYNCLQLLWNTDLYHFLEFICGSMFWLNSTQSIVIFVLYFYVIFSVAFLWNLLGNKIQWISNSTTKLSHLFHSMIDIIIFHSVIMLDVKKCILLFSLIRVHKNNTISFFTTSSCWDKIFYIYDYTTTTPIHHKINHLLQR